MFVTNFMLTFNKKCAQQRAQSIILTTHTSQYDINSSPSLMLLTGGLPFNLIEHFVTFITSPADASNYNVHFWTVRESYPTGYGLKAFSSQGDFNFFSLMLFFQMIFHFGCTLLLLLV